MLISGKPCEFRGCQAPAYWAVQLYAHSEPILFCSHHSQIVEPKVLELNPFAIQDNRPALVLEETRR